MSAPAIPEQPPDPRLELERKRATTLELAAAKADMTAAMTRALEEIVRHDEAAGQPMTPEKVREWAGRLRAPVPDGCDPLEFGPEQLSWHTLSNLLEHEPERGQAVWQTVKDAARIELRTGTRAARANRRTHSRPYDRAQFVVILEALREDLDPRSGTEQLLVQQMATAYEQHLRWQQTATQRIEEESWHGERDVRRALERMSKRERERQEEVEGWLPPRQSDAEAIEQAVLIADRYARQFLRLLRTFQGMRRVLGTVVMTGGQLNVAEQQVISSPAGAPEIP